MAKEKKEKKEPSEGKSKINLKMLLIGIPLFMLQLVVVYFITANILLNKWKESAAQINGNVNVEQTADTEEPDESSGSGETGKYVYVVEDIIVNPANTQGKRLMLTSLGFDLGDEVSNSSMEEKEIPVRDMIINTLASKTIEQLSNVQYRDTLKAEITGNLKKLIPKIKVNKVYFSKYIIQ